MKISQNNFDKASDTLFTFQFTGLPKVVTRAESSNLILNCNTISLPGISTGQQQLNWQGGYINVPFGNVTFNALNIVFLVDEDLKNWKTLFNWVLYCNNNKNKWAIEFQENKVTGLLEYYNNYLNKVVLKLDLEYLWCTGVGGIQLTSKTDGSQYLEAQADFTFDSVTLD